MGKNAKYDAIVIGAGHNGLVAAAYLARAGKKVVVVEKRDLVGGATVTEEVIPGFKFTVFSYVVSLLRPEIIEELELAKHGLQLLALDGTFTPLPDGRYLARWHDSERTRMEISRFSRKDADNYGRFGLHMHHMSRAVRDLLMMRPPEPTSLRPSDLAGFNQLAKLVKNLGERRFYDLARLMTSSAADYLDRWFECDPLKATMSASGIIGTFLSPRSPGSAYVLLHHYMGEIDGVSRSWGFARGGMGSVANAIASSARSLGAEIRTGAGVSRVLTRDGRAIGVVLENGEELEADQVASSADPKRTFLKLVEEREPRLHGFHMYVSEDRTSEVVLQIHPDAESMQHHLEVMGEKVRETFAFTDFASLEVYGEPNEELRDWLGRVSQGVEFSIHPLHWGGFTRL